MKPTMGGFLSERGDRRANRRHSSTSTIRWMRVGEKRELENV